MTDQQQIHVWTSSMPVSACYTLLDSISFPIFAANHPHTIDVKSSILPEFITGLFKYDVLAGCLTLFISDIATTTSTSPQFTHYHQFLPNSSYIDPLTSTKIPVETVLQVLSRVLLSLSYHFAQLHQQDQAIIQRKFDNKPQPVDLRKTARQRVHPASITTSSDVAFPLLLNNSPKSPLLRIFHQVFSAIKFYITTIDNNNDAPSQILHLVTQDPVQFNFPLKSIPLQAMQSPSQVSTLANAASISLSSTLFACQFELTFASLLRLSSTFQESSLLQQQLTTLQSQMLEKDKLISRLQHQITLHQTAGGASNYDNQQDDHDTSATAVPIAGATGVDANDQQTALTAPKTRKRAVLRPNAAFASKKRQCASDDDEW